MEVSVCRNIGCAPEFAKPCVGDDFWRVSVFRRDKGVVGSFDKLSGAGRFDALIGRPW